ncbi:MAG: arginine--tRNA ligase [Candidatus Westeberhardia cardiocondylae]|nr:arginine--tRNA ligase [Candidatus Westeberhardia cardiocondylae]
MNIHSVLSDRVYQALSFLVNLPINVSLKIHPSTKSEYGDYQIDGVMDIAKKFGMSSLCLARKLVDTLDLNGIAYKIDVISPGFINIFLDPNWLSQCLICVLSSSRLNIVTVIPKKTIVVDYSSPNIAKEMHVGHIRSTIIGDAFVRICEFLGYHVVRSNHVGDWGTQFGMLIAYLESIKIDLNKKITLSQLEIFYRFARRKYDQDPYFSKRARDCVVRLQNGDSRCLKIWNNLVKLSMLENQKIYDRLNITLNLTHSMGESTYNSMLPEIVKDLRKKGLALENKGAIVIFLDNFKNKRGKPMGVIIQKKDGAYLYSSTDIACIKYRCEILNAYKIVYYIDSRQHQYLKQIWSIAQKAGYVHNCILEHHTFGMVLGKNGKPFKTRSGATIKLTVLLNEAIKRARKLILNKKPNISKKKLDILSEVVGIGSIKYFELSKNRIINYIFDWDQILSFHGNTALYIQYAYTRIMSVLKKSYKIFKQHSFKNKIKLTTKNEKQLAVHLLQFEEVILFVYQNGTPHVLCSYLYNLSVLFSVFYEKFPIFYEENEELRISRVLLLSLISKTLKQGLNLLGIKTVNEM